MKGRLPIRQATVLLSHGKNKLTAETQRRGEENQKIQRRGAEALRKLKSFWGLHGGAVSFALGFEGAEERLFGAEDVEGFLA